MSYTVTLSDPPTPQQQTLLTMLAFEDAVSWKAPPSLPTHTQMDGRRARKAHRRVRDQALIRREFLFEALKEAGATVERKER